MYHTEPPTGKTIREWYMNSSRVAACALRNEQAVRAHGPGRPLSFYVNVKRRVTFLGRYESLNGLNSYNRSKADQKLNPVTEDSLSKE